MSAPTITVRRNGDRPLMFDPQRWPIVAEARQPGGWVALRQHRDGRKLLLFGAEGETDSRPTEVYSATLDHGFVVGTMLRMILADQGLPLGLVQALADAIPPEVER